LQPAGQPHGPAVIAWIGLLAGDCVTLEPAD